MANSLPDVIQDLNEHTGYPRLFHEIYEDGITEDNLADVLAEFEKTLITPNSPFDQYLKGDKNALGASATDGYA